MVKNRPRFVRQFRKKTCLNTSKYVNNISTFTSHVLSVI